MQLSLAADGSVTATATADGTIVVTNEQGGGVVFVHDGTVLASLPPAIQPPRGVR